MTVILLYNIYGPIAEAALIKETCHRPQCSLYDTDRANIGDDDIEYLSKQDIHHVHTIFLGIFHQNQCGTGLLQTA
jgi:hypothetical protein